jgi:hypothetical protein
MATVLCDVVYAGSNLCGLDSALVAGPIGSIAGALFAAECKGRRFAFFAALCIGMLCGLLAGAILKSLLCQKLGWLDGGCGLLSLFVDLGMATLGAIIGLWIVRLRGEGEAI